MTMLAQYQRARAALAEATRIEQVLPLRDEVEHIKLYAKQIQDRQLLADASEFQMRVERRLGVLLQAARDAGQLADKGRPKTLAETFGGDKPATLQEIGVDRKLSMKAQRAANLGDEDFEQLVTTTRERMASGRAIMVDPIDHATKVARDGGKRADHAARTAGGGTVDDLRALAASGYRAGAILIDPPWHFRAYSPKGDGRSASLHYTTTETDAIAQLPVAALAADDCVLFMWIVDWGVPQALALLDAFGFELKTAGFTWAKQNSNGEGWHFGQGYWTRANPETCWLATRGHPQRLHADVRQLIVAPVMEHSRKPDEIYARIERLVAGPYLELYARRPRDGWTSWGNELPAPTAAAPLAKPAIPLRAPVDIDLDIPEFLRRAR